MPRQKADPELLRQALALVAEGLSPSEASERLERKISKTTIYAALAQARGAGEAVPAEAPPNAAEADGAHPEAEASSSLLASEHLPGAVDPEDGHGLRSSPAAPPSVSPAHEPVPAPPSAPLPSSPPLPEPAPAPAEATFGKAIALAGGRARSGPGRRCACCSSEHRPEIDRLLCQGASYKAIEARLAPDGPSDDSIEHHARRCIPHLLGARAEELRAEVLTTVRARAERLMVKAERLVEEAEGSVLCANCQGPTEPASPRDRAATINAANSVIVTLGKLLGELGADVDVRVVLDSPRFAAEREAIQRALRRHPAARADVIAELEALAAQQGELGARR